MGIFDIDYNGLVVQLLPVRLRNNRLVAWLKCLISPVRWLFNRFSASRVNNLYVLAHNSQVCYLQAALNDVFDPVSRGILIVDGPFEDPLYLYLNPESKPLWLGLVSEEGTTTYPDPEVLFKNAETYALGICFIVKVPLAVTAGSGYDAIRLRALIDFYRMPGRSNYSIVTY